MREDTDGESGAVEGKNIGEAIGEEDDIESGTDNERLAGTESHLVGCTIKW